MKKIILSITLLICSLGFAQDKGYFFGGFESNSQWLLDDEGIMFDAPDDQFRANNYLQLNYTYGKFSAGVQYESYLPSALLGYAPIYDGQDGIAHYFLNYKEESLDITAGYFYEQFGSGLILRTWEDRQLGVNNAIRGIRVKFNPTKNLEMTGVYGQQRNGFEISEGVMQGVDANYNLSNALAIEDVDLRIGASYLGRYQDVNSNDTIPDVVNAYGGRLDFVLGNVYGGIEANAKSNDVIVNEGQIVSNKLYDGTSMQVNLGYSQKGLGITSTFRRLENWSFFSDRAAEGNVFNQQILNFVPALTKQQDYLLTNIYVYNAQPRLIIESFDKRAGEVGSQVDFFYSFKGDGFLAKYKTKIAANFSYWAGLDAEYDVENRFYEAKFIGNGSRYFRDFSFEVKNTWSKRLKTVLTFQDVIIDKGVSEGGPLGIQGETHAYIGVLEATYKLEGGKSFRAVVQHLADKKGEKQLFNDSGEFIDSSILDGNWAGAVVEYNFNSNFSLYAADAWNYGGNGEEHYYSLGGSYTKGRTRVSMNYGRQRGGLICVGGVCRFVPTNTGISANMVVSF
jgi:hypothetical protein